MTMKQMMQTWALLIVASLAGMGNAYADPANATKLGLFKVSSNWSALKQGSNILKLEVLDAKGDKVEKAQITVKIVMVDMPMNAPSTPVQETGGGQYEKQMKLTMVGKWAFDLVITSGTQVDSLHKIVEIL